MIIPVKELSTEILESIIKEFVLREGTEYGDHDIELSDKITQVKVQLNEGSAVLVYSELHETVNILPIEQFNQQQSEL
ncbi:MAG: hypothetical protein ACI9LM_002995 [Alteromonadaceae bacterium]|jgi:uncharacterized protein YheU (UPF0270 family)